MRSKSSSTRVLECCVVLLFGCGAEAHSTPDDHDEALVSPRPEKPTIPDVPPVESSEDGTEDTTEVEDIMDDACPAGYLWFDEQCTPTKTVKKVIEAKDDEVLAEVATRLDDPPKASKATAKLLEQQIVQVRKSEDDLDEIIRILEAKAADPKEETPL